MKILDASEPEFGGPMTEDEVRIFLLNSKKMFTFHPWMKKENLTYILHGIILIITMTLLLYVESGKESKKTRNLRRNNIIYYCIDDDNIPYKGVRGKGTVKMSEDVGFNLPIVERIVVRYLGSIEHPMAQAIIGSIRTKEAIIIEITPKFYATWDHAK
jgi:hypothetical protein